MTPKLAPRPVWARREARLVGLELNPPTDEEIHDAIRVLADGLRYPWSLYAEAEAIMVEVSEERTMTRAEVVREMSDEFLDLEDWL